MHKPNPRLNFVRFTWLLGGLTAGLLGLSAGAIAQPPAAVERQAAQADRAEPGTQWVRVARDQQGQATALQTAIVRYVPQDGDQAGPTVDLIGAIHVGDRTYYETLNDEFKGYDAVLYELVAPEGTRIPKGGGPTSRHPVGGMQNFMKDMLELEHQLVHIDYTKKNLVHADMSPQQFAKSMSDRGESFLQIFFRMMGQSLAYQSRIQAKGKATDADLLMAMFSKDRPLRLKRIMAEQFEEMEGLLVGLGGPDGSTLITERNKVALEVLTQQIEDGRKKLGVFYGAGHLADMDERLREEFALKPHSVRWVTAWNLPLK